MGIDSIPSISSRNKINDYHKEPQRISKAKIEHTTKHEYRIRRTRLKQRDSGGRQLRSLQQFIPSFMSWHNEQGSLLLPRGGRRVFILLPPCFPVTSAPMDLRYIPFLDLEIEMKAALRYSLVKQPIKSLSVLLFIHKQS